MLFVVFLICFSMLLAMCWGSFLYTLAYRIAIDRPIFTKRFVCPKCDKKIFWYDNIPLFSWVLLRGRCRQCQLPISFLYPLAELFAAFIFTFLFARFYLSLFPMLPSLSQLIYKLSGYIVFFSGLFIALVTDLQYMVIPQCVTLWLIPVGLLCSLLGMLKVSFMQSFLGAFIGYVSLWLIAYAFKKLANKDGLGMGDVELVAMIGSFTGPMGVWVAIFIGSMLGIFVGGNYIVFTGKGKNTKVPFGPFLVIGAILYVLFQDSLVAYFWNF